MSICNCQLTAYIAYHNFLHGFWSGRVTGTATIDSKLLYQLVALVEEVVYMIFLELQKAYNALNKYRCLEILEG